MATIAVHEFISLDGVFDSPTWTFDYGFAPEMGETLGAITGASSTILLGRNTFEMFAPAWRDRTVEDDPGAPFFNDTEKFVVGTDVPVGEWNNSTSLGAYDAAAIRKQGGARGAHLHLGQRPAGPRAPGRGPGRQLHLFVYPVALGEGEEVLERGRGPDQAGPAGPGRLPQRRRAPQVRPGGSDRAGQLRPASALRAAW